MFILKMFRSLTSTAHSSNLHMSWRGLWTSLSAVPRLWRWSRSPNGLESIVTGRQGQPHLPTQIFGAQRRFFAFSSDRQREEDKIERSRRLVSALRNENTREAVNILKGCYRDRAFGPIFFKANQDLQGLVESKLLKTLSRDMVYGDKDVFASLILFLGYKHPPPWSRHFLRELLDVSRFPKLGPSMQLDFMVSLLKICNQAKMKITPTTESDVDFWLSSFLGKKTVTHRYKRFCQLLSCAGNAELRLSGFTDEKLILKMLKSMKTKDVANPTHFSTILATYLGYWKTMKHIPPRYADEFWSEWQDCAMSVVSHLNPQDCSMTLNSIADLLLTPNLEFLRKLCEQMATFECVGSQYVSNSLRSLAWIAQTNCDNRNLIDDTGIGRRLMIQWLDLLRQRQLIKPQHLSNGIWGTTELGLILDNSLQQVLELFYNNSVDLIPLCAAQSLSNIFLSTGKLHQRFTRINFNVIFNTPGVWWKTFWTQFSKVLNDLNDQELCNIIAGLSLRNTSPIEYKMIPLDSLLNELKLRIGKMNGISISQTIIHLGHLRIKDHQVLAKAYFRAEELCSQENMLERAAVNLATGMTLLSSRLPVKLWEYIGSNLENMLLSQVFAVLDVCTIQSCALGQCPSTQLLQRVAKVAMDMELQSETGDTELKILLRAVLFFGEELFSKAAINIVSEKQRTIKKLLEQDKTGYFKTGEKIESEIDMTGILSECADDDHLDFTWRKVVPEAACTVNFMVQHRLKNRTCVVQADGLKNRYWDSKGNRTKEETAKTKTNTRLLEKLGYPVFRTDWDDLKNHPELVKKQLITILEEC